MLFQTEYSGLPNSRTVSNKRTGWEICQEIINAQVLINAQAINKTNMAYKVKKRTGWEIFLKLINAQCLISSHRTDFFLKKNKRTCATIRQVRVLYKTLDVKYSLKQVIGLESTFKSNLLMKRQGCS